MNEKNGRKTLDQGQMISNTVSTLKGWSMDPQKKNLVLSSLARMQGQINVIDYNEILANVKSIKGKCSYSEKALNHQKAISSFKTLEHEKRFR